MQFRFTSGVAVVHSADGVHGARIGVEWRDLPVVLHDAAIKAGCERSDQPPNPAPVPAAPNPNPTDYDGVYRQALTVMLERNEAGDFTNDSLPNINVVSKVAGVKANKEDVLRVFRAMKAEASA